ncbi:MAG: ferredoxin [Myxococcota bacterium]|jgi:ferredoxin|nr:hypothetical protein [Deltaproteobacteria bacterium]MCP4239027.1 ferredoxin [bacterium]MDP6074011.1 ferredoxin [Myxococcota bacterium]MDP6243202.1 ferredoxin [Myxococcota bacterium]MDP7075569.1 ferredoxin [Myxococcota bacterium]
MKLRVDRDKCVGHGRCYALASDVFGEDECGHCLITCEVIPPALEQQARAGVDNCPEQAIEIVVDVA